ncbi:hypothetical protein B0H11DRAFT_2104359, partial [Mycena galericulata]
MQRNLRRRRMSKRVHQREWMLRPRVPRHLGSTWHIPPCTHRLLALRRRPTSRPPPQISTAASARSRPSAVSFRGFYLPRCRHSGQSGSSHSCLCPVFHTTSTRLHGHPQVYFPHAIALPLLCIFIHYAYSVLCICNMHPVSLIFYHSRSQFPQSIYFVDYLEQASKAAKLGG